MTCEPRRVWISIGSNHSLKDRYVAAASEELSKVLGEYLQSEPYTTPALNGVDADYLNAVATGFFCGSAAVLSELCKGIENSLGRTRCRREGAAHVVEIDLDPVAYGGEVLRPADFSREYFKRGFNQLREDFLLTDF